MTSHSNPSHNNPSHNNPSHNTPCHDNPFIGTWNLQSSDHFDEYLKAVDVGLIQRKLMCASSPTLIFSVDGDRWNMKTETTMKNTSNEFKIGQEFDESTPDGKKSKTVFRLEGHKLIEEQMGEIPSTITREVNGNSMLVTLTAKDVVSKRTYTKKC